ncbi:PAS domain S-box-containing protein [Dyadobacter sp. SG02]|uniref:sensor histidine kinase n=1 Tax=Dyadobacter sp. SG02 TaxID=1855291 RepID=UPI0008B44E51|nr:ATP-binding protein [Dyadobacter sp. SG02]SEI56309.1 PAS domain S-box-containing protein [Dyadobacter sp. SG02]
MGDLKTYEQLLRENAELSIRLEEANDTIEAIRTGQIDALVVNDAKAGHQLYTLKTADHSYRVFIEKMNEGAVTLNESGIILYANSRFASILGATLSAIVGKDFESFVSSDCRPMFRDVFATAWAKDIQIEVKICRNSGTVPCQLSLTALQLDEGPSLSIIITDLTFQKNIQRLLKENNQRLTIANGELEASNHDLQQFASIASHDLQEPLRKILIFANMLRDRHMQDLPAESRKYLDKIISSSQRMRSMASDILSYSGLSTNAHPHDEVSLEAVVAEILDDYELLLQERNVKVIVEKLPVVEGNRGQLKQVFQNLISNSIKFSRQDKAPVIRIFCKPADSKPGDTGELAFCHIVVADNGIGFEKEYQERIFSLFERLNNKDKYEGSGIGLSITKKIIERHHGRISAESTPGEGARFTISLPVKQPQAVA